MEATLFGLAAIALVFVIVFEIIEYRKYRKAAHSVIAFGESMRVSFDSIQVILNRLNMGNVELAQEISLTQQELIFLKTLVGLHSEALGLEALKEIKKPEKFSPIHFHDFGDASLGDIKAGIAPCVDPECPNKV